MDFEAPNSCEVRRGKGKKKKRRWSALSNFVRQVEHWIVHDSLFSDRFLVQTKVRHMKPIVKIVLEMRSMSPHLQSESRAFTLRLHCYRVQNGPAPAAGYATMAGKLSLVVSKLRHLVTSQQHGTVSAEWTEFLHFLTNSSTSTALTGICHDRTHSVQELFRLK
jgi:hypothetical protein